MSSTEQQATTPAAEATTTTTTETPVDAGEAKSVLGQVWDSVATGVQSVAETIKHAAEGVLGTNTTEKAADVVEAGKEKAAELATTALEKTEGVRAAAGEYIEAGKEKATELANTALEKTEGVRATAGEYIAAGTEKATQLGQQALDKVPDNVKQAAGEYYEAGKEKAAALGQQALDKVPDNVKQAAGEYYEAGKEKASELLAAGQAKLATTDVPAAAEEVKEAVKEKKDDIIDYAKDTAKINTEPLTPSQQGDAKALLEKTHGDSVDVTGHIVVAPGHKEGKAADYEGEWQQVGKDGHHNAAPHIATDAPADK